MRTITKTWAVQLFMLLLLGFSAAHAQSEIGVAKLNTAGNPLIPNYKCHKCHAEDGRYEDNNIWHYADGTTSNIFVDEDMFKQSVHGKHRCNGCHTNITMEIGEHKEQLPIEVSCVECHKQTYEEQKDDPDPKYKRLDVVLKQVESYEHSIHARPSKDDPSKPNAYCTDCHDVHNIGTQGSEQRAEHRLMNPEVCGKCHEDQKKDYMTSVHSSEVIKKKNSEAAVCSDCHTTHNIESPKEDSMKLAITKNCGSCHENSLKTYMSSYHGQVNRLGYTHTAKCYDCHGNHALKKVDDPTSMVHQNNRLKTCQECHEDAPEGFLGFHPHGNVNDYDKYPGLWMTSMFMKVLIIGVFAIFWTHVILWLYREYMDRKQGKGFDKHMAQEGTIYIRRFSFTWRVIHLLFAVSTMILVLTGSALLFSHTEWASKVIALLGGPKVEAIIHRTAATVWLSVFLVHFVIVCHNIFVVQRKTFSWFGPTSMLPTWQDMRDLKGMFMWFFGKAERPDFDRWAYWQKFDYWAPFWGVAIIGLSGGMLFAPTVTAQFLSGYIFNLATIIHAEEALLATMFLFTVHFFNSHFRPDRFPMSTIIFTGAVPLEEFKHEHRLEYERLKESGELEKYIVNKPSKGMQAGSNVLAVLLILFGLTLLMLVSSGIATAP
jgi:cytochrome b subunit of formate dehydrogenase